MTTNIESSEELANILNQRMVNKEGGNNQRLAIMLGMLTNDREHPIKANIPDKDRSRFSQEKYKFLLGAPFEISQKCCSVMKKEPVHRFNREEHVTPITAQMASESQLRMQKWLQNGCNAFNNKNPISNPMAFWTEQDVLQYIYYKEIPIASVYGDVVIDYEAMGQLEGQISLADYGYYKEHPLLKTTGCTRTGCFACGYGMHLEKPCNSRIQHTIDFSNPKLADWQLRGGHFRKSDGMWEPHQGLGYWFPLMWIEAHSNIRYNIPNREHYLKTYSTEHTKYYLEN